MTRIFNFTMKTSINMNSWIGRLIDVNTEYRQKCLSIIENLRHVVVGEENSWKKRREDLSSLFFKFKMPKLFCRKEKVL